MITFLQGRMIMETKDLYGYQIEDLAMGVVKANNEEEARRKVYEAYIKHNDCFDPYNDDVAIWKIDEDSWFSDSPDVLEVSEV